MKTFASSKKSSGKSMSLYFKVLFISLSRFLVLLVVLGI